MGLMAFKKWFQAYTFEVEARHLPGAGQRGVIYLVVLATLGFYTVDILTYAEHWPFSAYRLWTQKFSRQQHLTDNFERLHFVGVDDEGREFALDPQRLRPLSLVELQSSLHNSLREKGGEAPLEVLKRIWSTYRQRGGHRLKVLRVYQRPRTEEIFLEYSP